MERQAPERHQSRQCLVVKKAVVVVRLLAQTELRLPAQTLVSEDMAAVEM